jgi:RNA polymerase sigma-70 factor (ECF subfamily)
MIPTWGSAAGVAGDDLRKADSTEPVSFRDFYDRHLEFAWRTARQLGVDDDAVDDVVQHVFLIAYRRFSEFRLDDYPGGRGSAKAWVYAILVRAVREYRRATKRRNSHADRFTDPETLADMQRAGPHDALANLEAARLVQQLLDGLDEGKREVFVLAELEQLTAAEISQALGINANTVSSRLRAARQEFEQAAERHRRRDTWKLG